MSLYPFRWQRSNADALAALPLNRALLRRALPTLPMNLTVPLAGVADTAVVGHPHPQYDVGAASLGTLTLTIFAGAFGFFCGATVGQAAQGEATRTRRCGRAASC
jgi:Na+-driven multidrug efflux pump